MYSSSFISNSFCSIRCLSWTTGYKKIAESVSQLTKNFADKLKQSGYELYSDDFFDTVTVKTLDKTEKIYKNALDQGVNIRRVNSEMLAVSFDERKNLYRANHY